MLNLQWALMTRLDPAQSIANLIYIGHNCNAASALHITRRRSLDRKKQQTERSVFQCFVFGPKKAGKTALLMSLLGRCVSSNYICIRIFYQIKSSSSCLSPELLMIFCRFSFITIWTKINWFCSSIRNENFVVSPDYRPFSENYIPTTREKYVVNVVNHHLVREGLRCFKQMELNSITVFLLCCKSIHWVDVSPLPVLIAGWQENSDTSGDSRRWS